MICFLLGFIVGMIFALYVSKHLPKAPLLIDSSLQSRLTVYTITNSSGESEQIMTNKSMKDIIDCLLRTFEQDHDYKN